MRGGKFGEVWCCVFSIGKTRERDREIESCVVDVEWESCLQVLFCFVSI